MNEQFKFILLIDQDGVLAGWYPGFLKKFKETNPNVEFIEPEDLKTFYIEDAYPKELTPEIQKITRGKGFYRSLPVLEGAAEALKDIQENCLDFIEPFICTAPEVEFEDLMCHSEKVQWIRDNLGDFWVKKTIITKDKTVVLGHALIDDKPKITGAVSPFWDQLIFSQPYNQGIEDGRYFKWEEWDTVKEQIRRFVMERREEIAAITLEN